MGAPPWRPPDLYKVVGGPVWADLGTAAAIGGAGLLDVRVAQLEEGREPRIPGISRGALVLSAIGLGVLVAGPAVSLAGTGGLFVAMHRAMPVAIPIPLRIAGLTACTAFWAWVAWLVLTGLWLARDSLTLPSGRSTTDMS